MDEITGRITSEDIQELKKNEIFVFGSNEAGLHGSGAARTALIKFKAIMGQGFGFSPIDSFQCFAIPTKNGFIDTLPLWVIKFYIDRFIIATQIYKDKTYLVTQIGCGLAGYKPKDIAPMFRDAIHLDNIHLPQCFWDILLKKC
jgi:hypothetical protein